MQWEGNVWKNWHETAEFLLHDNALAHRSLVEKKCFAKHNVTVLELPPYSLDFLPPAFFPLPRLNSVRNGQGFASAEEVTKTRRDHSQRYRKMVSKNASKCLMKVVKERVTRGGASLGLSPTWFCCSTDFLYSLIFYSVYWDQICIKILIFLVIMM
jgi:hypothetical protein